MSNSRPNSVAKVGGIVNFTNQFAAIAGPVATVYLIGSRNDYSRAFIAAAVAILVGIAGDAALLGKFERIPDPAELVLQGPRSE